MAGTSKPTRSARRRASKVFNLEDFEDAARRHLPKPIFDYIAGASEDSSSFRRNRSDFEAIRFIPRVLAGKTDRDQSVTLFGKTYDRPFGIAPMGLSALAAFDGDVALAKAARQAGTIAVMSATSLTRLERVAEEAGGQWFQAYFPGDHDAIAAMTDRIATAGFQTLVVTADVAANGNRELDRRNGFVTPMKPSLRLAWSGMKRPSWLFGTALRTLRTHGMPHFENLDADEGPPIVARNLIRSFAGRERLSWPHIERLRERWRGNLVLKGVLAPEDAARARKTGFDGIVVSNHGGRQLDGAISPIEALPSVAAEAGDMVVIVDSGVRRGADVLKLLAMGAHFCLIGRPMLFAASIAGEYGVNHAIDILSSEIDRNMALLSIGRLSEMSHDCLLA